MSGGEVLLTIMDHPLRAAASAPSGRGSASGTTFSTLLSDRARAADEALFVLSQVGIGKVVSLSAIGPEAEDVAKEVREVLKERFGFRTRLLDGWRLVR